MLSHVLLSVISGWDVKVVESYKPVLFHLQKVSPFTVSSFFYAIKVTGQKFRPTTLTGEMFKSRNPWADVRVSSRLSVWNKIDEALERNVVTVASSAGQKILEVGSHRVLLDFESKVFECGCPFYSPGSGDKPGKFCKHLVAAAALFPRELAGVNLVADDSDEFKLAVYYAIKEWAKMGWFFGSSVTG